MYKALTKEFLVNCVGLEQFVSTMDVSECCESIGRARKLHIRSVLDQYKKLKKSGVFSPVMLAHVSAGSSKLARKLE